MTKKQVCYPMAILIDLYLSLPNFKSTKFKQCPMKPNLQVFT